MQKGIKVFMYGKRLKDVYPFATRWEVFKYRVRQFCRRLVVGLAAIALLVGVGQASRTLWPTMAYSVSEREIPVDNLGPKIEELKAEVLANLRKCESAGHQEDDGIIIFDSNEKASIGSYQFQKMTVIHYYQTLYDQKITGKEAVLIALDDDKAGQLAKGILFEDSKGWRNWYNCGTKLGLESQINFIKKLSK